MGEFKSLILSHLTSKKAWAILLSYIAAMILAAIFLPQWLDRESIRQSLFFSNSLFGYALYILLMAGYIILVPFYNTPVMVASGYFLGSELGWLANFAAATIGLFVIVWLVKSFGRPIVERLVARSFLEKYDKIINKIGPLTLFVIYVLPITPDDEVTYLVAAAPISFKRFILPILFGNLAKSSLSLLGDQGAAGLWPMLLVRLIVLVIGGSIIYWQELHLSRKSSPVVTK